MGIVPKASKAAKRIDKAKVFGKTQMYLKKNKMKAKPPSRRGEIVLPKEKAAAKPTRWPEGAATQQDDDDKQPLKLTYTPTTVKKRPASAAFASASAAHPPTSASKKKGGDPCFDPYLHQGPN